MSQTLKTWQMVRSLTSLNWTGEHTNSISTHSVKDSRRCRNSVSGWCDEAHSGRKKVYFLLHRWGVWTMAMRRNRKVVDTMHVYAFPESRKDTGVTSKSSVWPRWDWSAQPIEKSHRVSRRFTGCLSIQRVTPRMPKHLHKFEYNYITRYVWIVL